MSIANECMLVNLQVGLWMGYRLDKEASRQVTENAGAELDAARVNKHLIPKESLKPIQSAASSIRTHFYTKTLPWKDNGDRLLTRRMFTKFVEEHERLTHEFNKAVQEFASDAYLRAKDQAAFRMGELFNPDDYPAADVIQRKFYVHLDIDAVTEAGDFRVEMDAEHVKEIQQSMKKAMGDRITKAMGDVWARLADTLGHYAEKMASDGIFRDSTVKNLEEIVEILPDLNILDDPNLEAIRMDIRNQLIGIEPKQLRTDKATRNVAADEAKRIMDQMAGFMNAFAGAK
jgi:hemoglobin-like flavoprotein